MIFVEPYSCWSARMMEQRLRAQEEARRRNLGILHPIQPELLNLVANQDEPIRDTTLAREFAKIPGYRNRKERDDWIKKAWAHLTALIRMGKLQWSSQRKLLRPAVPS
jgi:hypothetical protein